MTTLVIEGRRVTVDDRFLSMSPDEQNRTVEEIAEQLRITPQIASDDSHDPAADDATGAFADTVGQFGERFNRGLYSFANFPTDLANMATGALGVDYRFKRPLEAIAPSLDQSIMDVPEAQSAAGRVAGTVGEFMGANALPGAGLLAAAPRLAAATQQATGLGGQAVNRMAAGISAAPGTAAAGELASSVGAGLGASMAEDASPNAQYLASLAGGILAPAAIAMTPTNLARKGAQAVTKRLSPESVAKAQRQQIVAGFRDNLTPDGRAAIDDTLAIQRDVPDYRPSVAEATENPAFIATQREFEKGLSGTALDQAVRRYGQNEDAIARAKGLLGPQSPIGVDESFQVGRDRIRRIGQGLDQQAARIDERQAQLASSLQSGQRQRELGSTIRDDLISRRASTKEEMGITAREFGLNDQTPRYDFRQSKAQLIAAIEPRSALSDRSALPGGLIDDIRNAPDAVSIDDLMTLRTRITDDIREASRTPTGEKRVPYLQTLKTELDAATENMLRRSGDGDLADDLSRFRQMYRDDFVQPFEQGAAAKVLKTDTTGAYVVRDEQVAKEFFGGWNQTAADQFRRVFPDKSSANAAMEAAALDDLHAFAVRDGVIDSKAIEAWTRRNAGVLNDFPSIRQKVGNVDRMLADLSARRATVMARKKQAESSVLAREVARIENATAAPEMVIQQALRNPARMTRLLNGLKTEAARSAVAREVWDIALDATDPVAFLRTNTAAAQALGKHLTTAQRLARAIEKNRLVPRPAGHALDTNPMATVEATLGTGLNQISSRIFAVKSGRTSSRYALADIAGRAFRSMTARQARETLQAALYDPAIARDLANAIETPQLVSAPTLKRLYTFILANGLAVGEDDAGLGSSGGGDAGDMGSERRALELTVRP